MFALTLTAAEYPIKSVTVFKSKAEVVRTFALDLQAGQSKIEITDLPSVVDANSVRVSGLGNARLFDVVYSTARDLEHKARAGDKATLSDKTRTPEAIRLLQAKKDFIQSQIKVREYEAQLLLSYAKTLTGEHVAPTAMIEFLSTFVKQGGENLKACEQLTAQVVEIDREITTLENKLAARMGSTSSTVTIVIGAADATHVDLKLTYVVFNASWSPTYDLHATTANGKPEPSISLHYRARVTQRTGEDWTDTTLTLSTVALEGVHQNIPQLQPSKLKPVNNNTGGASAFRNGGLFGHSVPQQQQQAQIQTAIGGGGGGLIGNPTGSLFGGLQATGLGAGGPAQQSQGFGLFGSAAASAPSEVVPTTQPFDHDVTESESFEEIAVPGPFSQPTTVVTETPLAISYSIDNQVSIPSDGLDHHVSIAMLSFDAKVSHIVVPRLQPRVYLQCQVKNTSEYRLLPGPVSVIMDDSYISSIKINEINKGDTFDCTLGTDLAAKVTYARTFRSEKSEHGPFVEASNTTTYCTTVTLHNQHAYPLEDLIVRENLPTVVDKRGSVVLRKPVGLADAKAGAMVKLAEGASVMWSKGAEGKGGDKTGIFEWRRKVDAGEKVTLEAEWEVRTPARETWLEYVEAVKG